MPTRRRFLGMAALGGASLAAPHAAIASGPALPPLIDDIARRTFRYFRDTTDAGNGLAPDRWPSPSFSSIAATGFALTAWPIGVTRGWIGRTAAAERTRATLRFFWNAPQGPGEAGVTGHKGFFYHFLDMKSGHRFARCELSSVDTTLLVAGMLFAAAWFDGRDPVETEIRDLAQRIYARIDWRWMQADGKLISMGWHPESGFIARGWDGYNEGMLIYLLALGAPEHALGPDAWANWCASYPRAWRGEGPTRHLGFGPHFGHQYSHIWVDFRGIRDAAMRQAGFDYFENSRRATWWQRSYAAANPMGWAGYSADIWGLTACDGPAEATRPYGAREAAFHTYAARGPIGLPDGLDDGTIAPTAAIASLPFAPEIVLPAAEALHRVHGKRIYRRYGFLDSFNPSFRWTDAPIERGHVDPRHGWVDMDYLGIDQGPILAMIANHRDDLIWSTMRRSSAIRTGLQRAGFTGGWLD
ncbi:MAG: Tat pathway signal protein [Sphingomonas bacterium]|uniref:glucoamylase family protein n=1 Tax=Sphingomonas bacterium TaxID=1895847 RepID=UPI00263A0CD5|nr:glucoamylase family protein [Sphingomonas bacterium]MDB5707612.1 Tat pathway signal protein [Sphingomonas bacterium]